MADETGVRIFVPGVSDGVSSRFPISEAGYLLATGIHLKERSSMKGDGRRKQHNMTRHPRMLEPSATHMRAGIPLAIARTFCHYATGAV